MYQYVQDGHLLLFDGQQPVGWYDIQADPMLQHNLLPTDDRRLTRYTERTQAIIQSYMQRMVGNQLTP